MVDSRQRRTGGPSRGPLPGSDGPTGGLLPPPPGERDEPPTSRVRRFARRAFWATGLLGVVGLVLGETLGRPLLSGCSVSLVILFVAILLFVAVRAVVRRLLWGVGRRLLVSYLLVGVLPLPFIAGFLWVCAWLMSGQLAALRIETAWQDEQRRLRDVAATVADGGRPEEGLGWVRGLSPEPAGGATQADADGAAADLEPLEDRVARALSDPDLPAEGVLRLEDRSVLFVRTGDTLVWEVVEDEIRLRLQEATGAGVAFPQSASVESSSSGVQVSVDLGDEGPDGTGELFRDAIREGTGPIRGEIVFWARSTGAPLLRAREGGEARVEDDPFLFILRTSIRREMEQLFVGGLEDETNQEIASALPPVLWGLGLSALAVYVLAGLVAGVLVLRIARATARLDAGFRHLETGDFGHRVSLRGRDQLASLGDGFNRLAAHLDAALEARAEQEATQRELQVARDLQQSLLPPRETVLAGLNIAADVEPAAAVGGDFFHVSEELGGRLVVGVGDVSGHGLPTGIVMAATRALVSAIADPERRRATDAPELMRTLDRELRRMTNRRTFVTLVCCVFDPGAGRVEVTSAGHLPPWCLRADGRVEIVEGSTRPLGVGPPTEYETVVADLAPGDRWVLLSDGFIEGLGRDGEPFGFDRFETLLADLPRTDAAATRDLLVEAWEEWTGRRQPEDDRTVCVVEWPEG